MRNLVSSCAPGLVAATLLASILALSAAPAGAVYGPPDCESELPLILNVGLPYMERVPLETLERSLRAVIEERYLASAPCPGRALRVNVALGSDYQVIDWLDRGLVDMGVVPALGLHLLRRDGLDLVEIDDPAAGALEQLVGRVPRITFTWVDRVSGEALERTGHAGDLEAFTQALWAQVTDGEDDGALAHLVVPSHLSTAGFLMPVLTIDEVLESLEPAREAPPEDHRRFWEAFYERVCFRFGEDFGRRDGTACAPRPDAPRLEVEVVDESAGASALESFNPPVLGHRTSYRDRLVIRREVASSIFGPSGGATWKPAAGDELHRLEALLDRKVETGGGEVPRPTAFDRFLVPDGYFGTRTFGFRIGETLDLVQLHQRMASRASLSLVLPGGGVKAAYQSRILDELYRPSGGRPTGLVNVGAVSDEPADAARDRSLGPPDPLRVDSVVGTSGGALLGFFVARLGPKGPGGLSNILWKPGSGADGADDDEASYLTASEIFGWTDLPRYISLVVVLGIFGLVLALFSWRRSGFLAPERRPEETLWHEPSLRPALLIALLAVVGLTPLLVRWVSGPLVEEHVPEFEGLLYAVLLVLAMFADQCVVMRSDDLPTDRREAERQARKKRRSLPPSALFAAGGVLTLGTALLRFVPGGDRLLESEVTAGGSYLVLALLAAAFGVLVGRGRRIGRNPVRNLVVWLGDVVVGTAIALGILRMVGPNLLAYVDRTPLLFLALFGALLVGALVRLVRSGWTGPRGERRRRLYDWSARFARTWIGHKGTRFVAARAVSLLGCVIALDLTRPEADVFATTPVSELFLATSKLHAPRGALAVCMGAVLLLLATVLFLHRRGWRYRLEGQDRFGDSVILVITGLALSVYLALVLVVWTISKLEATGWLEGSALFDRFAELTLFELTPMFWIGLAAMSVVASFALVLWARVGCRSARRAAEGEDDGLRFARWVCRSLAWLCAVHPNGHLLSRRVARLGVLAVTGLVWWNFLLAPALYGNRYAFEYLEAADRRFDDAYVERHGEGSSSYSLTARYLAPANALSVDGTRFVLAVADAEDCPAVPASPGVTWRRFRAVRESAPKRWDGCVDLALADADDRRVLQDYIFASGSPFPAFPPRRVPVLDGSREPDPARLEREALVDGGYSNNVPLEAAAKIGAKQALVVHSSHPGPTPSEEGWFTALAGPLVDNLPRILGFLYERSQQADRRSRSDLFVVSLAPPPADDWPLLTDFRSATVERMIRKAEEGLHARIGMVESWGPPEFQTSLRIEAGGP